MAFPRTSAKDTMAMAVGLLVLFIFGTTWVCDARELMSADFSRVEFVEIEVAVMQRNHEDLEKIKGLKEVGRNENICTLCEEFAAEAIKYLEDNKTQTEVIEVLYKSCSRLLSFEQQCISLVDYYVPLLFAEIESVQPSELCEKLNLCEQRIADRLCSEDKCEICQEAVAEVLLKLKDPDTQLEIIKYLLKACSAVETYVKKCKVMVFEYVPLILANAEKFLKTTDICTTIHACDTPSAGMKQASMGDKTPLLSVS